MGNAKEFKDDFGTPIEKPTMMLPLQKKLKSNSSFMMRRLKSDKTIISDLPDKIEMDAFSTLAKEQASLYEKPWRRL